MEENSGLANLKNDAGKNKKIYINEFHVFSTSPLKFSIFLQYFF